MANNLPNATVCFLNVAIVFYCSGKGASTTLLQQTRPKIHVDPDYVTIIKIYVLGRAWDVLYVYACVRACIFVAVRELSVRRWRMRLLALY